MEVEISGRHFDITDVIEDHVERRIKKLPRYDDQILRISVVLEVDSGNEKAEVIAKCRGTTLVAESTGHDMHASIDEAFSKMEREVKRHHEKLVDKRNRKQPKPRGPVEGEES